jgi:ketosteroid isomerase-like protein
MNNPIPLMVLLVATACVIPATAATDAPAGQSAIVQAVLAANTALIDASNRLDTDAFFAGIIDSDETRIIQDGKLFPSRAEVMAAVRQDSQGIAKLERRFTDPHVTVLATDVALLTAAGSTTVTLQDGRTFGGSFAVSLVFVLRDGRWMLFHGHFSLPNPSP